MKVTDEMIIECAFSKGFKLPTETFEHFGRTYDDITEKDIVIHRGKTGPISGNKDLGEWWLSYPGSHSIFVVKDDDLKAYLKAYIRDYKIDNLLN